MTLRLLLLIIVFSLLPNFAFSAVSPRTLEIEISFDTTTEPEKTFTGFKLYQDEATDPVCDTIRDNTSQLVVTSAATYTLTCVFDTEDTQHYYELAVQYSDAPDSERSPKFYFTISDDGDVVGTLPVDDTGDDTTLILEILLTPNPLQLLSHQHHHQLVVNLSHTLGKQIQQAIRQQAIECT